MIQAAQKIIERRLKKKLERMEEDPNAIEIPEIRPGDITYMFDVASKVERICRGEPGEDTVSEIHFHVHRRSDRTYPGRGLETEPAGSLTHDGQVP